jgi:membrane protein
MNNVRQAIDAMWRPVFDDRPTSEFILLRVGKDFLVFLGLVVLAVLAIATTAVGTSITSTVLDWLAIDSTVTMVLIRLAGVVVSVAVSWALFLYIYRLLPSEHTPRKLLIKGSLIAAGGLVVLQHLMSIISGIFANNRAAAIFGPVIIMMLLFNLVSMLILLVASWTATGEVVLDQASQAPGVPYKE